MASTNNIHTKEDLINLQNLSLDMKITLTKMKIEEYIEWCEAYGYEPVVSFSGGKDSTVLLHIARQVKPDIKAVFSNTGLEYPELQAFVRRQNNVDIVRPSMMFTDVVTTYGYPVISKEVAEAIYYARRINLSGGQNLPDRLVQSNSHMKTAAKKRTELRGLRLE